MRFTSKTAVCAALSTAFLLGAAAPGQGTPIAAGGGVFVGLSNGETRLFAFQVVELPDGSVRGRAGVIEPVSNGFVHFQITSYAFAGNTLAMAGPITETLNAPPEFIVGATAFFAVNDNDPGADGITGIGVVPPVFGNLTIQQILAILGPPPAAAFSPLLAGDIRIL